MAKTCFAKQVSALDNLVGRVQHPEADGTDHLVVDLALETIQVVAHLAISVIIFEGEYAAK